MSQPAPRPGILSIAPYVGGESGAPIRLASNEAMLGPSPRAIAAMARALESPHRYPDGSCAELRRAIGAAHGLDPARIVCGAGSEELISLLIRSHAGPGDQVIHSAHGFLMHRIFALAAGAEPVAVPEADRTADLDAMLRAVTPATKIVMLANPNNPTGTHVDAQALRRFHAALPGHVILGLDAAYAEFAGDDSNGYEDGLALACDADNVVVLRTFSKIHGLAGLRIGWAYAPAATADALNRARNPFNVSAPGQAAAAAAIGDAAHVARARTETARIRRDAADSLRALGLFVLPSFANFLCVDFGRDAEPIRLALKADGILIRQLGAYGLPTCLRITIGRPDEMAALVESLARILKDPSP